MRPFIAEIDAALTNGAWSVGLACMLMLPDACGAVEYPDIKGPGKNSKRYATWYDHYVGDESVPGTQFNGEVVWALRNGMMHETSLQLSRFGFDRIMFFPPGGLGFAHLAKTEDNGGLNETALSLDLQLFCRKLNNGVLSWLAEIEADVDQTRVRRMSGLIQLRPMGIAGHVYGTPLIA